MRRVLLMAEATSRAGRALSPWTNMRWTGTADRGPTRWELDQMYVRCGLVRFKLGMRELEFSP